MYKLCQKSSPLKDVADFSKHKIQASHRILRTNYHIIYCVSKTGNFFLCEAVCCIAVISGLDL